MRRALAAALLLALGAFPAAAAEVVDLADAEKRGWLREDWYGVWCGDVRVGWMRRALVRTKFEEREAVAREVDLHLDVVGDGNELVTRTRTVFSAEAPQLLLAARLERAEPARAASREIVRRGMRFDVVTERQGERVEGAVASAEIVLADELGFERAVAAAGAVAVSGIDLGTLGVGQRTYTAAAVEQGLEGAPAVFDVSVAAGTLKESARVRADGAVLEGSLGSRFRYRRCTGEEARDPAFRGALAKLSRVELTAEDGRARLGDVGAIRKLVVAWDDGRDRVFPQGPRQHVRREGTAVLVEIRRDDEGAAVDDAARAEALRDGPGLDLADPVLGQAVTQILADTADRGPQVGRLLEFTSSKVRGEAVPGTLPVRELLRDPRGDCTERTRLFVALCRAAGIPARTVEGLAWAGDESGSFGPHTWAEVALAGKWVPVDPSTGANPAPVTNIVVEPAPELRSLLWGAKLRLAQRDGDSPH